MLIALKAVHTVIWLVFVLCIVLLPVASAMREFWWAKVMTACIFFECGVLAINRGQCPITTLAARYTEDRRANFDIYLPEWLARHNKHLFGSVFAADILWLLWQFVLND